MDVDTHSVQPKIRQLVLRLHPEDAVPAVSIFSRIVVETKTHSKIAVVAHGLPVFN